MKIRRQRNLCVELAWASVKNDMQSANRFGFCVCFLASGSPIRSGACIRCSILFCVWVTFFHHWHGRMASPMMVGSKLSVDKIGSCHGMSLSMEVEWSGDYVQKKGLRYYD